MDLEKLKSLMAAKKQSMKKTEKTVKVSPGKNRIRLLPGWRKGEEHVWFHDFGQHFIKDAADQIQAVYVCTSATFETRCPVCEALANATRAAGDDTVAETLEKAKASRTVLVNALMLDSNEPNTPVILELKRGVFAELVTIVEEWGASVFDLDNGQEIVINREGKGLNTKYSAQISPKKYPVPAAALTKLNNLDDYVKQESEEQQRRALGAINSVAGIAPPGADVPLTSASRLVGHSTSTASATVVDDEPDPTADIGSTASAAAAAPAITDDLDDLLASLPD
ncbi:hypothetical protein [Herbaspirillum huttiense]|uniref:Bacteriophage T4 Gp32 single-stranded DNA-binding domain-containing protein n=1 Tax=Herbaspirillum huttiense subsp. lycopersici TaxID=3074428 RepID=A0ABU2EG55_9BURK|nr:hypothetical protein [Herbaspirillum huttiense]MDR9847121.1 hypothetical protein [Herbaspirillum huttiense SE1]